MVINLVDAIGGITLYNDQNYDITCYTNRSCTFKPGNNTVDGKCLETTTPSKSGTSTLSIASLKKGVYLVVTESKTFKISKK